METLNRYKMLELTPNKKPPAQCWWFFYAINCSQPGLPIPDQIMREFMVQSENRSGVYFMYMSTGSADLRLK